MTTRDYSSYQPYIYEVTFYMVDPETGEPVLDENGEIKVFCDFNHQIETTTWAEWVDPEHLREVEMVIEEKQ